MPRTDERKFKSITFWITQIPDTSCSQFQAVAEKDVRKTIWQSFEHITRAFSNMKAGGTAAEILYIYNPSAIQANKQDRLQLYLKLHAKDSSKLKNIEHLVTGSMLSRFYEFKKIEKPFFLPTDLEWHCSIIRREDFIRPLHTSMFNAKIPACYYTIDLFEANEKTDLLMLDRVLDKVDEPVIIKIKIEPADVCKQLHAHTGYLAHLGSINRSWDDENELCDSSETFDFPDDNPGISRLTQSLNPLSCKDPLADDIFRQQKKFHESLRRPHLKFDIRISAKNDSCVQLVGSVIAESAFVKGSYRLVFNNERCESTPENDAGIVADETAIYNDLRSLAELATVDELTGLVRLPMASCFSPFCIRKNTDPQYIKPEDMILLGYDDHGIPRGIHIDILKKHCSILGLPGSGKTTSNINMLIQLWERNIPFLVIESAKTEYRAIKKFSNHKNPAIKKLAKDLRIFTAGNQTSPLNINPFRVPQGIAVEEHIENLLACFKAVLPVSSGSLPALLGEALEKIYEHFPDPDKPPVISDLVAAVQEVLNSKGYSPNTKSDMQTVIEVRLGILAQRLIGDVFGCRDGISIKELMENPSIVELDRLCSEQKCLPILFKLTLIREILKTEPSYEGPIRFAILIEEAHNIFGSSRNTVASEEVADPKSQLTEFLFQMMVELRALGVAIILSDQHPTSLDAGAIKTPASKLAFWQVHNDDRDQLGSSMLLDGIQMEDLARMKPGEAFFYTQGYHYPIRIKTINLNDQFDLSHTLNDQQLYQIISKESWFKDARIRRLSDQLDQFKDCMDNFDKVRKSVNGQIGRLITLKEKLKGVHGPTIGRKDLGTIIEHLRLNKNKLTLTYRALIHDIEKHFGSLREQNQLPNQAISKYAESLFRRFDNIVKADTEKFLSFIDIVIRNCIKIQVKEQ